MVDCYRFGGIEVRPDERRLLVDGQPAAIGARAFDVLLALIDRRDRIVRKDELLELVWPGVIVEENNLQVQVSTLRKVLGARAVATIPGHGYRFTLAPEEPGAAPRPGAASRHNLPAPISSFIGRAREIAQVRALLGKSRLVTLTGTGGTGKTRLSLQVAREVLGDFPDGAWLVELAPVSDPRRVPHVIAFVLDLKEEPGHEVAETIAGHVRGKRLLLVLDNCEHVLDAAADMARTILTAGSEVRILASSRESLRVAGESIFHLPALGLPEPGAGEPEASEAVRLFLERAQAAQPRFALSAESAATVAAICRRLDGLPLAIELAAARVRTLSLDVIAAGLDQCLRTLTSGDRSADPRQRTLRASIDWSHDLLSIPERMLLRRLSVFAGGWTLEAAEAVCAGGDVEAAAVMEIVSKLVEKSLVEVDGWGERYRLLETVRQYAAQMLDGSGERDAVRGRHLDFHLAVAEEARKELVGPRQGEWLARLDQERENLLCAHRWCDADEAGGEKGLRLVSALKHYWIVRGLLGMGQGAILEALGRARAQAHTAHRSRSLFDAGQIAVFMGRYGDARRYLEESLAIARELDDRRRIAAALQPLGVALLGEGDYAKARGCLEEALELAKRANQPRDLAAALTALAQLRRVEGALDTAEPLYEQVLEIARTLGDHETLAIALLNLAMVSIGRGRPDRARLMLVEALAIARSIGSRPAAQSLLEVSAGLAAMLGDFSRSARLYGSAEAIAAETGLRRDPADEAFVAPLVAKARAALGAESFSRSESEGRSMGGDAAIAATGEWLGSLELPAGRGPRNGASRSR